MIVVPSDRHECFVYGSGISVNNNKSRVISFFPGPSGGPNHPVSATYAFRVITSSVYLVSLPSGRREITVKTRGSVSTTFCPNREGGATASPPSAGEDRDLPGGWGVGKAPEMSMLRRRKGGAPPEVPAAGSGGGVAEEEEKKAEGVPAIRQKKAKWSCVDNCCWFIGCVCSVWWLLLFLYNAMPASFPQYVTEAITGPLPDPPGLKLKKEGLTARHPVVFVPGIVTGGLELWEGHQCADGLFRKRLWGGTFGEVYKRCARSSLLFPSSSITRLIFYAGSLRLLDGIS